ncbi:HlyD family efflux transporter periplasmic adaptor subunit [Clostridium sp. FP2]|nr:HlyD family efflux transporter periplasmic adaptor subunit [Clostridium sp. FP2]
MKGKFKLLLTSILVLVLLIGGATVVYYWYEDTHYVSTDNAVLSADFIKVTPFASGKLLEFNVKEGDSVVKDQLIGRLDAGTSGGAASNIRAPISGTIVQNNTHIGEYISSLQVPTLALIMNPQQIYVTANIDETDLNRIKVGQPVNITIDQFKGKKFTGKVKSMGQASADAFSFLPAQTTGTFTKVEKRVQVKIEFDSVDTKLLPGTNAIVKIQTKK